MLELKNISYFYKSQKDKMVLDQISYQFEKGKMYAILGASGSGKTTLFVACRIRFSDIRRD